MSKFSKGDKVKNTITNEIGYIIEIHPPRRGRQLYKVKYDDREADENSDKLLPNVDLTDPFERRLAGDWYLLPLHPIIEIVPFS